MRINEEARTELFSEVNNLTDEEINIKPADDQWSIKQVMEHLFLMEGAITKTIINQLEKGDVANPVQKPIEASTNRSTKVDAPDFAVPNDEFASLEELKLKLTASHRGLIEVAENVGHDELTAKGFNHPIFGLMSLKQWIPFVGYHEKRHILQIKEVKEKLGL